MVVGLALRLLTAKQPMQEFLSASVMLNEKKFIIIGNQNAITCKEIFPYFQKDELWFGTSHVKEFKTPCGEIQKFGNICWYTNIENKNRNTPLDLYKRYSNEYPKYDNYDAIEVSKVSDIPMDYNGIMGVPISFLHKYNPEQFEIAGMAEDNGKGFSGDANWNGKNPHCVINGKNMFKRIFIRKRNA